VKIKNQIINYFIDLHIENPPKVFKFTLAMDHKIAKKIIEDKINVKISSKLLHIGYDNDSEIIYIINSENFNKEQIETGIQSVKYYLLKEHKNIKNYSPIYGSPFSSLRLRYIDNFGYVKQSIKDHFNHIIENLPVIEANLERMPSTINKLPAIYKNQNYYGGLIDSDFCKEISFIDEINTNGGKRTKEMNLLTIQTPFILINISNGVCNSFEEKEWAIISGYRDYLNNLGVTNKIDSFAPIYAAKRFMYLGWSFEEICNVFLDCITNFNELNLAASYLQEAKKQIQNKENYVYYIYIDKKIDLENNANFTFHYNEKYTIIESKVCIKKDLCEKIFHTLTAFTTRYDVNENKLQINKNKDNILSIIENLIKKKHNIKELHIEKNKTGDFSYRKISDYSWAKNCIINMCKNRNIDFEDVPVVVGPIEDLFGSGTQGGFMGEQQFKNNKIKTPYEIKKGVVISPPVIMVNSRTIPSYAAQTEVLIHEYSHKIFENQNPFYTHLYNKDPKLKESNPLKYWELYLTDEDEIIAHKEEIKFGLIAGKSIEEIIRDKIGGAINKNNYKLSYEIAIMFKKIIDEVVIDLGEKNE
jgi:hypothetical protein